ncbi:hypothetical protein [Streptomyces griseorubiginosus]|uniref:hypothetical protein n=1 Tax=Streptomyces griseorubiginosus TaxID=67304 RepID=UPI001AD6980F|nr:hypothetical protein [Streptomyces griseorubiginosus]MBO4254192.1 hypothetical protein [Streptomyces griseorubiginosus]
MAAGLQRRRAVVFTDAPQSHRLEYGGFLGVDSLGRQYRQPPYPHIEPAFRQTEPAFLQALQREALPR